MYGRMQQCQSGACGQVDYAGALTGWAKAEILREKVKQRLEKKYGKSLDEAADLIVEVATTRVKGMEELEEREEKLQESMDELFEEEEA
jgi:hypothetical protein